MGYAYQGTCFSTAELAASAHCTGAYPISGTTAEGGYVVACTGTGPGFLELEFASASGASVSQTLTVSYAECDPSWIGSSIPTPAEAAQAFTWGFSAVLICWLAGWSVGALVRLVR